MPPKRLLLVSRYAFYSIHWQAFSHLCQQYNVQGAVISDSPPELPSVHRQLGWVGVDEARAESFAPNVREMPTGSRRERFAWLHTQLDNLQPDVIWIQEEPTDKVLLEVLRHYRGTTQPRIVGAVVENIFRVRWWKRPFLARTWRRLDRLMATATPSIEGIRQAGMPASVPADTLVAGCMIPPTSLKPLAMKLQREPGDWLIGFAGRICPEKGWHILLDAIEQLPPEFKVAFAGGGPQAEQLQQRLASATLRSRSVYVGLLPKLELWSFYKSLDCVATPHLTFPRWKEQFGGVLADAMAVGVPIVGSNSGSIPEVVGPAGLIVPENDAQQLAAAFRRLRDDPKLARQLATAGQQRFEREFSIPAYADKIAAALQLTRRSHSNVSAA